MINLFFELKGTDKRNLVIKKEFLQDWIAYNHPEHKGSTVRISKILGYNIISIEYRNSFQILINGYIHYISKEHFKLYK